MKICSIISFAVAFSVFSTPPAFAKSKRKKVYNNTVFNVETRSQHSKDCDAKARDAKSELRIKYYTDPNAGATSKAAASFGSGIASGYLQRKEEFKLIEYCLEELGYKWTWLTDKEMVKYK